MQALISENSRISLLQQMPIFGGIRQDVLKLLLGMASVIEKRKQEFFFRESDDADCLYVLERGSVAIIKRWEHRDYLLNRLVPGDCFGEMAIIDLGRRGASVLALEECAALRISTSCLYQVYQFDLEQFTLIYMNLSRELCRRLRHADERLFIAKNEAVLVDGAYTFRST